MYDTFIELKILHGVADRCVDEMIFYVSLIFINTCLGVERRKIYRASRSGILPTPRGRFSSGCLDDL